MNYEIGKKYWILENQWRPREVILTKKEGSLGIVKFKTGGGIRIPLSRLLTDDDIQKIKVVKKAQKNPYEYWH